MRGRGGGTQPRQGEYTTPRLQGDLTANGIAGGIKGVNVLLLSLSMKYCRLRIACCGDEVDDNDEDDVDNQEAQSALCSIAVADATEQTNLLM